MKTISEQIRAKAKSLNTIGNRIEKQFPYLHGSLGNPQARKCVEYLEKAHSYLLAAATNIESAHASQCNPGNHDFERLADGTQVWCDAPKL